MRNKAFLAVLTICAMSTTSYAVDLNSVVWFDLSDWTSIDNGESNFFANVYEGNDLTVTAIGDYPLGNKWWNASISAGHPTNPASHSFRFDYTGLAPLIVEVLTLDSEEAVEVHMFGDEQWQTVSGNDPIVTPEDNGLRFRGIATGFPGVSNFVVYSDELVSNVLYTHAAVTQPFKYEFVRIGVVVPEPGSFSLLGLSLLGMLRWIRRK